MAAVKLGKLLIVDDEVRLMNALCETLTEQGYETTGLTSRSSRIPSRAYIRHNT